MHQNSEAKQPKETDEIKKKLESYAEAVRLCGQLQVPDHCVMDSVRGQCTDCITAVL